MNAVLREEKKFLIGLNEFKYKSHQVGSIMMPDPHNGLHGYKIRSLYFDTPFDDDFFEKQAGIENRRKIRLRCYDPKHDYAMMEMKQKQGMKQLKRSLRVSREEAQRIIAGDYSPLLLHHDPFGAELYALMKTRCYQPKTIVEYNRQAFIERENKTRVTFDHSIVATESSFDLFSEQLLMNPVLDVSNVVLEVKFNGFLLSYVKNLLASIDKSELSVSKYVLARQQAYLTHI